MWLLIMSLASVASWFACPGVCECDATDKLHSFEDYGFNVHNRSQLCNNASHLMLRNSDRLEVANLFTRLQNSTERLGSLIIKDCNLRVLNVSWFGLEEPRKPNSTSDPVARSAAAPVDGVFANLTSLDLSYNCLETLDNGAFGALENLLSLQLGHNRISKVDERAFQGLSNLETLDLAVNRLDALPSGALAPLDALQKLNLRGNKLQVLGASWFETLARLRELDVSRNALAKIASGVLQPLSALSVLTLAENPLMEADVSLLLGTGRRLETVDASGTGLVRVPAALTRSIRTLRLAYNKLTSIRSGDLDSYPLLRLLDLSDNRLTEIEEDALGRLEVLEELDISVNRLPSVPRSLPSSLTTLDLTSNAIATIKVNDLQGLHNVRILNLNNNRISVIEEGSLSQMPALHKLDISNNPIKALSANALSGPNDLAVLLMASLWKMEDRGEKGDMAFPVPAPERLVFLDLSRSPILAAQFLADDAALSACKSLKTLNLAYNNVSFIRPDLRYVMPQLWSLGLSGNDWNCSPDQFWLGDWLEHHSEIMPRARCSLPKNVTGKYLVEYLPSAYRSTLIPQKTENTVRDADGGSSAAKPTTPVPARRSNENATAATRPISALATSARETGAGATATESPALLTFKRVFLSDAIHLKVAEPPKINLRDSVLDTIAEELNSKVTDPGARLAPEPLSVGPHPGMLVLAGAALAVAVILTLVLSRRASRRSRDKYHRHENIEVHSLTPTAELW